MTDQEKIDSLQKQLDLTNRNYNILNEKHIKSNQYIKLLESMVDYFATKYVLQDLTEGD